MAAESVAAARGVAVAGLVVALPDGRRIGPIDFTLAPGECLGVVGESGSGKSLAAQALAGLLSPGIVAGGRVVVDGVAFDPAQRPPPGWCGARVGYVFQDALAALHPLRTIGAQLAETLRAHGRDAGGEAVADALREVALDPALASAHPHRLSGGQRQRALIALALAPQPALLLADEPTSALDVGVQREVLDLLQRLRRARGLALVFIGHDLAVVAELADRLLVLRDGAVVEQDRAAEVLAQPRADYTRALVAAQQPRVDRPDAPSGAPLVEAASLRVRYPQSSRDAVDGVDLSLAAGEALALVGESGCGKSTLARALLGLQRRAPGGRLVLCGTPVDALDAAGWKALRRRVQVVFQDPYASLDPRQTVATILAEPRRIHGLPWTRDWLAARLAEVGLDETALDRYPHAFSGGQRQRIAIARALALDPELLVCDEAVSALDALFRAQVLDLLAALRRSRGLALLFVTHDLGVARALCERVAVMQHGRIVETGASDRVLDSPTHPYTRALLAARPHPLPTPESNA